MNYKDIVKNSLSSIASLIDDLTESDIKKLESGEFELKLKITKKISKKSPNKLLDTTFFNLIIQELNAVKLRDEGMTILDNYFKNKVALEVFARHIDVAIIRSNKVQDIKETIVDATVGARLRSGAIQGKDI